MSSRQTAVTTCSGVQNPDSRISLIQISSILSIAYLNAAQGFNASESWVALKASMMESEELLLIRLGFDIQFELPVPVAMIALFHVHPTRRADLR